MVRCCVCGKDKEGFLFSMPGDDRKICRECIDRLLTPQRAVQVSEDDKINLFPSVFHALNTINKTMAIVAEGGLEDERLSLDEKLIACHPEAYLSAAFSADYNDDGLRKLIKCLEGALNDPFK